MTITDSTRNRLPAVVCKPWCDFGGGHEGALFRDDQACMGREHIVPMSLEQDNHCAHCSDGIGHSAELRA